MIAPLLLAATDPGEPGWNCADPQAQQEMNFCAAEDFRRADAALNAQWTVTVAAMKARDAELDRAADSRPGFFARLIAAQRAWLTYRDAHCDGKGFAFRGGSMEPLLVATCRTELTQERTRQLKELVEQ